MTLQEGSDRVSLTTGARGRMHIVPRATTAAVVCHPHPHMGGDMHDTRVEALCHVAHARSITTFRFNFRKEGATEEEVYSNNVQDVQAALAYVDNAAAPKQLLLIGYSYGAAAAVGALASAFSADSSRWTHRLSALVLVSPPLVMNELEGRMAAVFKELNCPVMLAVGDSDIYCPFEAFARFGAGSCVLHKMAVPGADHFWGSHTSEMARKVWEWLQTCAVPVPATTSTTTHAAPSLVSCCGEEDTLCMV
mmetsp:Transcript_8401/g.14136  ORF Transcript_8401/g.14136 Transcript_8401/m.14136 type:complete len:250 (-) Transcript_8401:364-1113(-)|eukprot:CAMPEP_0119308002 /NCGR_PEP_ID=MMETSP1333-20130426/8341_1 /TAXON_ID=418940 /ORGANISM="Scyphosphaera apsteinii, Strain RCC1455" /LENGTH=249 /DNA_ID=CAMNT_0007311675 /DNA_START=127 /DNA_END=876 /DNA_ORIENTATION=+